MVVFNPVIVIATNCYSNAWDQSTFLMKQIAKRSRIFVNLEIGFHWILICMAGSFPLPTVHREQLIGLTRPAGPSDSIICSASDDNDQSHWLHAWILIFLSHFNGWHWLGAFGYKLVHNLHPSEPERVAQPSLHQWPLGPNSSPQCERQANFSYRNSHTFTFFSSLFNFPAEFIIFLIFKSIPTHKHKSNEPTAQSLSSTLQIAITQFQVQLCLPFRIFKQEDDGHTCRVSLSFSRFDWLLVWVVVVVVWAKAWGQTNVQVD